MLFSAAYANCPTWFRLFRRKKEFIGIPTTGTLSEPALLPNYGAAHPTVFLPSTPLHTIATIRLQLFLIQLLNPVAPALLSKLSTFFYGIPEALYLAIYTVSSLSFG